ncbi:hypothetical protein TCAL_06112 [Tigriopus californicus]|uniref:Metalloendopeptidase n=1 Tax=Tigriopus californicus TaxID=6832 RepID=A0A553NYS0_TIGCA|nr:hypothetical protein TCAL_06112 [Tigriopus californicus]
MNGPFIDSSSSSATAPPLTRTELAIASRSPWTSPPSNAVKLQALDRRVRFRNYFTYVVYRWPNNRIPYSMDYRFTSEERVIIAQAFQHIEENSCVTFSAKTGSDQDFVHLYLGEHMGCFADDHYQAGKGQHIVHLNRPICMYSQVIAHELLHLLGVGHEHQRPDRDDFVRVNWNNIIPDMAYNFFKDIWQEDISHPPELCFGREATTHNVQHARRDNCTNGLVRANLGVGYDYQSIMHYETHFFAINASEPTLISKSADPIKFSAPSMTAKDVQKLQRAYNCNGTSTTGCGGHLHGDSGSIEASAKSDCEWLISVDDGFLVQLEFPDSKIEDCNRSNLTVINANKELGPHLGTFCGQKVPEVISSLGNSLTVVYHGSQSSYFKAKWSKAKAKCCSHVTLIADDPTSILATRYQAFLGSYNLIEENVNGAPHYILQGNPNIWLARFLPLDAYTLAAWTVAHRLVAPPGGTTEGEFYLGGNVQCPHLASVVLFRNATGLIHENSFRILCQKQIPIGSLPGWPFIVNPFYPVLNPIISLIK